MELIEKAADYENKCDWASAISVYEQIRSLDPSILVISKLAWCYSRNSNFEEAKVACGILIEKEPNNPKWLYMYGYQFYMQKNWLEAIKNYEKALEFDPEYFVVLYRISYAYLQLAGEFLKLTKSEYWKAIGYLKRAHQIWSLFSVEKKEEEKSTYFHINFIHGKALMLIPNHNSEAIRLFKQALLLRDDIDCRYNLAKALTFEKKYEQAKSILPKEHKYYIVELEAEIEYNLGNKNEALEIISKLLKYRQKDYLFCFAANIKLDIGEYKGAYQFAKKAVLANDRNHKNYYMLARVYFKFGLYKSALDALDEAERLKTKKYSSGYKDCEDLREQIHLVMGADYEEDVQLVASLENAGSYFTAFVVQYDDARGFGFVYVDNERIFVHISNVKKGRLFNGAKIQFRAITTGKGRQAVDITVCQ